MTLLEHIMIANDQLFSLFNNIVGISRVLLTLLDWFLWSSFISYW